MLHKSSGHAPTEVALVAATEKTLREQVALTSSFSVGNVTDFKYVEMAKYVREKPKLRDVGGSGQPRDGEGDISAARRRLRRCDRNGSDEYRGDVETP